MLMREGLKRRGAIAAQAAICLGVLLGISAVTIDGGLMQAERRRAQATADAAALADDGPAIFVSASAIGYYGFDRGDVGLVSDRQPSLPFRSRPRRPRGRRGRPRGRC